MTQAITQIEKVLYTAKAHTTGGREGGASRTSDGLIIEGDIANSGKTTQDVPRLRVALRDAAEKEVQFKIVDPPQPRLAPGAIAHFKTPFDHPDDAAKGVVVTFAKR